MEIIDVRADGHIAESTRRVGIVAGEIRDGGGRGQLPHPRPENQERARSAVFGQVVPALALGRKVEVSAIQANGARLGQRAGRFFLPCLAIEHRNVGQVGLQWLAAVLPPLVDAGFQPGRGVLAGGRVEAHNRMVPGVSDAAIQVVPHERVVAVCGIGNSRVARCRGHEVVGEAAHMGMVQGQRDVARDGTVFHHWRGPADDALELLAVGVFLAGKGLFLGLELDVQALGLVRRHRPDDARPHVRTDHI